MNSTSLLNATLVGFSIQATLAPLIGSSIQSATGVVYNITGGKDITLQEVNRVSQVVTSLADPSANIIFGAVVDERYNGEIHVTIIAAGFIQSFQKTLLTDPRGTKPEITSHPKFISNFHFCTSSY